MLMNGKLTIINISVYFRWIQGVHLVKWHWNSFGGVKARVIKTISKKNKMGGNFPMANQDLLWVTVIKSVELVLK